MEGKDFPRTHLCASVESLCQCLLSVQIVFNAALTRCFIRFGMVSQYFTGSGDAELPLRGLEIAKREIQDTTSSDSAYLCNYFWLAFRNL